MTSHHCLSFAFILKSLHFDVNMCYHFVKQCKLSRNCCFRLGQILFYLMGIFLTTATNYCIWSDEVNRTLALIINFVQILWD